MRSRVRRSHNSVRALSRSLAVSLLWAAATPAQETVFRTGVELRQIEVRVTAKGGEPVEGLKLEDFRLTEDGDEQQLVSVDYIPGLEPSPRIAGTSETAEIAPTPAPQDEAPTWVYIATQSSVQDYPNVNRAIQHFIKEQMRVGMRVSIGGAPFTTDRVLLLRMVEAMRKNPFGRRPDLYGDWLPKTVDITNDTIVQLERERSEAVDPSTEPQAARDPGAQLTTGVDSQIDTYFRVHLYRYLDLIRELSVYPGKKIVVLFRGGLRSDVNNYDVLERIAGESVRSRVTFYTVDSRGLDPILPVADGFSERQFRRLASPSERRPSLVQEQMARYPQSQHGLYQLAAMTGGQSELNTNDGGMIFDRLAEDLGGYYLLSYVPRHGQSKHIRHSVKVRVSRNGVKVRSTEAYYDRKAYEDMSESERRLELHRTLLSGETPRDLDLRIDAGFYRGDAGKTLLVYSVAVPSRALTVRKDRLSLGVAVHASDPAGMRPQQFEHVLAHFAPADADGYVHYAGAIPLDPGDYQLRAIVRDEPSGSAGSFAAAIEAPDFSEMLTASTILLSAASSPAEGSKWARFEVQGRTLVPISPREFHVGDSIYALFDVYNTPAELMDEPQNFRMALLRDTDRVDSFAASSFVFPDPGDKKLRYFLRLDTQGLEPGPYTLFALLPKEGDPYIFRTFELLAK